MDFKDRSCGKGHGARTPHLPNADEVFNRNGRTEYAAQGKGIAANTLIEHVDDFFLQYPVASGCQSSRRQQRRIEDETCRFRKGFVGKVLRRCKGKAATTVFRPLGTADTAVKSLSLSTDVFKEGLQAGVVAGANYEDMALAANTLIEHGGGQVVVLDGKIVSFLPLPIAGIASDMTPEELAQKENELDEGAKTLGSRLPDPIFYLSFLPITAIPDLAITDGGNVDYTKLSYFDPILQLKP